MSTPLGKKRKLTPDEYLAIEEKAEYKSEYWDGVMVPLHGEPPELAGATENHILIVANLTIALGLQVRKNGCRVLPSEMKVWAVERGKFFYPDITVVCGESQYYRSRRDAILNPLLIVEVLSDSTEAKDRGDKFRAYRTIKSLQEYILIAQDKPVVERFVKQTDESWTMWATIGLQSKVALSSVEASLVLKDVYTDVDFGQDGDFE